jgi:hypothetical protein
MQEKMAIFICMVQVCKANKYRRKDGFFNFYFLNLACSQFWLNLPVDHSHFGYFKKLTKKHLVGGW